MISVPQMATRMALSFMRSSIKSRAKFDINDLEVLKTVPTSFCPALFAHGLDDSFILPHHSQKLHEVRLNPKLLNPKPLTLNSPEPLRETARGEAQARAVSHLPHPNTYGSQATREGLAPQCANWFIQARGMGPGPVHILLYHTALAWSAALTTPSFSRTTPRGFMK